MKMAENNMVKVTIDGVEVGVPADYKIIDAARGSMGIYKMRK